MRALMLALGAALTRESRMALRVLEPEPIAVRSYCLHRGGSRSRYRRATRATRWDGKLFWGSYLPWGNRCPRPLSRRKLKAFAPRHPDL